jgi:hypothetical protein
MDVTLPSLSVTVLTGWTFLADSRRPQNFSCFRLRSLLNPRVGKSCLQAGRLKGSDCWTKTRRQESSYGIRVPQIQSGHRFLLLICFLLFPFGPLYQKNPTGDISRSKERYLDA